MTRAVFLAQPSPLTSFPPLLFLQVRFFGKFLGTHADYFVFETTLNSPAEEPGQQLGESRCIALQQVDQHSQHSRRMPLTASVTSR